MSPFAIHSFRWLFIGQAMAQLADWLTLIALLVGVYTLEPSPYVIASVFLTAVCGRWCGDYVGSRLQEKHPKRLMIQVGLLRAMVTSGLSGGLLRGDISMIFLFLFGSSLLAALYDPLCSRLLVRALPDKEVIPAASALAALANTAMVTGCVTVIICSALFDNMWLFVLSGALYILSACSIGLLHSPEETDERPLSRGLYGQWVVAGVACLKQQERRVRLLFGLHMIRDVFFGALLVAVVCKVLSTFDGGSMKLGIVYLILALTYPIGALLLNRSLKWHGWKRRQTPQLAGSILAFYLVGSCFVLLVGNWYVCLVLLGVVHFLYVVIHSLIEDSLTLFSDEEERQSLMTVWQLGSRVMQGAGIMLFVMVYRLLGLE